MSRNKYITKSRAGVEGSIVRGHVIYTTLQGGVGLGGAGQGINQASSTQRYSLGTRLVTGDGRVFRYGKLGANIVSGKLGLKNNNELVTEKATIVSACTAGATELTVTFATDFWTTDTLAADELYGGYISLYNSSSIRDNRMIIGNTVVATAGVCTIKIDEPIVTAVTSAFGCEVLANPYADLRNINDDSTSVMGMPAAYGTSGQYIWIQTWGPFRISPTAAELGTNRDERQYVFEAYGGLRASCASIVTEGKSEQMAGFVIEKTAVAAGSAAPFIMLQISP